jgi:hypothetical protein
MSEISRFSWYPHFDTFFKHFIRRCRLPYMCFLPPFLSTPSLFPCFLCIKALFIDTDGTWYIGNNEKAKEWGRSHIYGNRQRRIKCLKNVSKWGYHENRDISDILKNYRKSFWILKEGWKGYILFQLGFL